jgi:hypothetical protein
MSEARGIVASMAELRHQAAARLFSDNLRLGAYLVAAVGKLKIARGTVALADTDLSLTGHGLALPGSPDEELRADVVTITSRDGAVRQAIISEPQSSPPTMEKWFTWVIYIGVVGRRYGCRVILLVLPLNRKTARACGVTFFTGHPGFNLTLVCAGPGNTPDPGEPGGADVAVQVAMLSFLNGKVDLADANTRNGFFCILGQAGDRLRAQYTGIVCALADSDLRKILEEELTTTYEETFWDKAINQGVAQGRTEGEGVALLRVLKNRGLKASASHRREVNSCTSRQQMETWIDLASTASTIEDVFGH